MENHARRPRKKMKLLLEVFWRNAVDEYRPQFTNEQAIGLFTASGFCLIGIYGNRNPPTLALVILNCAIGLWRPEEED